jgi:hypothetical protein
VCMWTIVHPSTKLHGVIGRKTLYLIFLLSQIDMCDDLLNVARDFVSHADMINELLFSFKKKKCTNSKWPILIGFVFPKCHAKV